MYIDEVTVLPDYYTKCPSDNYIVPRLLFQDNDVQIFDIVIVIISINVVDCDYSWLLKK